MNINKLNKLIEDWDVIAAEDVDEDGINAAELAAYATFVGSIATGKWHGDVQEGAKVLATASKRNGGRLVW